MSAADPLATLREGVKAVHRESAGVLSIYTVTHADGLRLIADALRGDAEANGILNLITGAQRQIDEAPKRRPMLCSSCPMPLRGGDHSFVVAVPATSGPRHGIALAVCLGCGTDRETVQAKGLKALAHLLPNARIFKPTHMNGGRA